MSGLHPLAKNNTLQAQVESCPARAGNALGPAGSKSRAVASVEPCSVVAACLTRSCGGCLASPSFPFIWHHIGSVAGLLQWQTNDSRNGAASLLSTMLRSAPGLTAGRTGMAVAAAPRGVAQCTFAFCSVHLAAAMLLLCSSMMACAASFAVSTPSIARLAS